MIYIFDKTQAIIKVLTNDDFTAAHLNFKINTATMFEFSLPASKALPSGSKYVATPHPLNDSKFIMLRLTERVDKTETIDYSAYELAYQELATDGYIEDKRPQNQSALNLMKIALNGSNWELNNVNVSGTATTNFYYVDRLSAISKVVDLLGGEIVFYIEIQGNAISGRYMDYLARQGSDTSKVFASGSNLLTVERQSDTSNIYTAILPRGKGEEIDDGEADTPDGYGRRINIADVEWKKSAGNPLDKPKGSIVLSDPDATAEWGQINGNARLLLQTYDDIDDVNVLINSAYKTLQSVNHPQIQYSSTVADVGGLSLGDTVLIMHGDRDLSYKTRVFEVKYDLLSPDQTELSLGDDLSSNSITSQINSLNAVADTTSSQTQWTINQIGRPSTTFGNTEPANPKVGDVFFKELPDGGTEIYRWNGDIWELLASPTTADDIAAAVDDAVTQAKSHTDEVKQGLSTDINTAKSQAASQASIAEANAKSAATSQFTQAQSALSAAKTDLTNSIASEASQAVAAANSQAQNYVNQAKSDINDTINALSVGGRNYLADTANENSTFGDNYANQWGSRYKITLPSLDDLYKEFKKTSNYFTLIFDWKYTGTNPSGRFIPQLNGEPWQIGGKYTVISSNNTSGTVILTASINSDWSGVSDARSLVIRYDYLPTTGTVTISNMRLLSGNMSYPWTPAPEDVVLDYTTKDNKIKETISQYQETNDGNVSRLQTDVTKALGEITTKISKTEYDQKTGELSRIINETKDTADKSAQTIADIQEADGKQDARMSEIENTASGLKSTVSDLSTEQGKQSGYISELQQSAKGFEATVTKVDNLSVGGRNLFLGTKDFSGDGNWTIGGDLVKDVYQGLDALQTASAWGGPKYANSALESQGVIQSVNDTFIMSAWVRNTGTTEVGIGIFNGFANNNGQWVANLLANSGWIRISSKPFQFKQTSNLNGTMRFEPVTNPTSGYVQQVGLKLEKGSIATDWSPAPEDIESAVAQVKITADGTTKFVRDSSGNISSDFQTALSKTSIITGSTLATSIRKQTSSQISSAITDNNGKLISLINQDTSGVQIAGKNIVLNGDTTVTGAFKVSQANIANGAIGTAQIGDAAITSAKIANLDVSKITGDVSNFIQSNWNGKYSSTTITSTGMTVGYFPKDGYDTVFDKTGITFSTKDARYAYATAHYGTDTINNTSGGVFARGMEIRFGNKNGVGFDYFAIKSPGANNLEFGSTTNSGHVSIAIVPDTNLMPIFSKGVTILDDLYVGKVNGAQAGGLFTELAGETIYIATSMNSDGTVGKWRSITL